MPAELETARLLLRPFTLADLEPYVAMVSDSEVTRFTSIDGKPLARFSAWQSFCSMAGHWALRGYGMFSVIERDSQQFVLIAPENTRSIRVAERLGEQLEARVTLPHVPERPILQYGLSRDAWRRTIGQRHA